MLRGAGGTLQSFDPQPVRYPGGNVVSESQSRRIRFSRSKKGWLALFGRSAVVTHIGGACRAACFLPIAMPSTPTGPSGASAAACSSTCRASSPGVRRSWSPTPLPPPATTTSRSRTWPVTIWPPSSRPRPTTPPWSPCPHLPLAGLGLLGVLLVLLGRRRQGG